MRRVKTNLYDKRNEYMIENDFAYVVDLKGNKAKIDIEDIAKIEPYYCCYMPSVDRWKVRLATGKYKSLAQIVMGKNTAYLKDQKDRHNYMKNNLSEVNGNWWKIHKKFMNSVCAK